MTGCVPTWLGLGATYSYMLGREGSQLGTSPRATRGPGRSNDALIPACNLLHAGVFCGTHIAEGVRRMGIPWWSCMMLPGALWSFNGDGRPASAHLDATLLPEEWVISIITKPRETRTRGIVPVIDSLPRPPYRNRQGCVCVRVCVSQAALQTSPVGSPALQRGATRPLRPRLARYPSFFISEDWEGGVTGRARV